MRYSNILMNSGSVNWISCVREREREREHQHNTIQYDMGMEILGTLENIVCKYWFSIPIPFYIVCWVYVYSMLAPVYFNPDPKLNMNFDNK